MTYETEVIEMIVKPKDEPIFSEQATTVRIVDEAAGCFVEVKQFGRNDLGKIRITDEEWPAIRETINQMIKNCVRMNKEGE